MEAQIFSQRSRKDAKTPRANCLCAFAALRADYGGVPACLFHFLRLA
jgi:hypothetical protein